MCVRHDDPLLGNVMKLLLYATRPFGYPPDINLCQWRIAVIAYLNPRNARHTAAVFLDAHVELCGD